MTTLATSLTLACAAVLSATSLSAEYVGPSTSPPTPTDTIKRIPRNAYEDTPAAGLPYSSLFRDTGAPYFNSLRNLELSPESQITDSVGANAKMDLPDFRGQFPLLQRGFAPEEADLKVGPLYFKLRHISAAGLFSDNINRDNTNKESDFIGIVTIGGQVLAQLSEGFRIAVAGNFVYLPTEGEAGFSGFALRAPYSFGLGANPSAHAQVVWEPVAFGLPITIADEFTVGLARYSNKAYDGFDLFDGGEFDEQASAGIYTLRTPRNGRRGGDYRDRRNQNEFEQTYYSNRVSLATSGRLPGDTVLRARASHTDIWYQDNRYNFPGFTDSAQISLDSDRDNVRFKPFVSYLMRRRDNPNRVSHTATTGLRGPITDLLYLDAEGGYTWVTNSDSGGYTWKVGLFHRPGPYTRQSITYARGATYFLDEFRERLNYRFHKILGPDLTATAYAGYHWIEDLDQVNPDREEFRTGLRFNYIISPKSAVEVLGQYASINYDDGLGDTDTLRLRAEYRHKFLDRLTARIIYQHTRQTAQRPNDRYDENLGYVSLSWIFD